MYSYEDRIRAVQLYLKLGRRLATTLRQLGYPTKNSLLACPARLERATYGLEVQNALNPAHMLSLDAFGHAAAKKAL